MPLRNLKAITPSLLPEPFQIVDCHDPNCDPTVVDFTDPECITLTQVDEHGDTHTIVLSHLLIKQIWPNFLAWKPSNNP